ncbi:hypothetical protein KIW84_UN0591 [Lathyrus oleraceus]|nr:hypothetical protein KIW84_UN0591 [Pisum sativum]
MSFSKLDLNLSFYFNCSSYPPYLDPIGCFRVSNDEKLRSYVFVDGDEGEIGYDNWKCEDHVVVSVKVDEVSDFVGSVGGLINGFGSAIKKGLYLIGEKGLRIVLSVRTLVDIVDMVKRVRTLHAYVEMVVLLLRVAKKSYNCGNITNIFYPFWGQDSSTYCGAGSPFYLNCHENLTTTILLFSQNFTVLDINTKKHTIKLKRTDLSQNLCSPQFDDIVLSSSPLFHYLPHVKTINIYFNCPSNFSQFLHIESICGSQNQVFDSVAYDERLFRDCENYIQVPVGEDFSMEKNHLNRDELVSGLDKGFEVNYTVSEECLQCLGNQEGDCRLKNIDDFESSCYYCPDGSHASSTHCSYHHSSMFSIPLSHI